MHSYGGVANELQKHGGGTKKNLIIFQNFYKQFNESNSIECQLSSDDSTAMLTPVKSLLPVRKQ